MGGGGWGSVFDQLVGHVLWFWFVVAADFYLCVSLFVSLLLRISLFQFSVLFSFLSFPFTFLTFSLFFLLSCLVLSDPMTRLKGREHPKTNSLLLSTSRSNRIKF